MSSTHSIGLLNGEMCGDPLDIEMLKGTGFEYKTEQENYNFLIEAIIEPNAKFKEIFENDCKNPSEKVSENMNEDKSDSDDEASNTNGENSIDFAVIKRFDFSSQLQRMSVITRGLNDTKFRVFSKGSPEKIKELSLPETIPDDFYEILTEYTQSGLRVLGVACKVLQEISYEKIQSKTRDEFEYDLVFCGFLIMENMLKPETAGVIDV